MSFLIPEAVTRLQAFRYIFAVPFRRKSVLERVLYILFNLAPF